MSDQPWEYGFYDSDHPEPIWWYCFGLPFQTAEQAMHTAEKNCWGYPEIVRRRKGSTEWEHVEQGENDE